MMLNLFLILLVAHLIADFPLQTPMILRWKFRGGLWILPHVFIHAAVLTLLIRNPLAIGVIVVTHFFIDWIKVAVDDGRRKGIYFLLDQTAHIFILWLVSQYGSAFNPHHSLKNLPIILGLAMVSAVFMFINVVKTQTKTAPFPQGVWKYAYYVSRVSGWTAVFSLLLSVPVPR